MKNIVELDDHGCAKLVCAIIYEAVAEYFDERTTPAKQATILKDLRSGWFSNPTSIFVADQLVQHPENVREELRKKKHKEAPKPNLVGYEDLLMEMQEQM